MGTTYKVEKRKDGYFYVVGLKGRRSEDQMILHHIPYPETETPEVENPEGSEAMLDALYDMYQWHDGLKEGDRFETPFGNFRCVSFHVVPA
jgi:hypothetical protein